MRNNNPISLFVLMLMLLICPGAKAQKYVVYSVVGKHMSTKQENKDHWLPASMSLQTLN